MAATAILEGPKAVDAATVIAKANADWQAWDLGPDFGQTTARILMFDCNTYADVLEVLRHYKSEGWLSADGWRARFDGPPFRMGGDISVVGTPIIV
jgi:hypothetical protein